MGVDQREILVACDCGRQPFDRELAYAQLPRPVASMIWTCPECGRWYWAWRRAGLQVGMQVGMLEPSAEEIIARAAREGGANG